LARSKREGTPVGVVIADLDHFKQINDRYSHLAGDAVLREVAQRINSCVRSYDFVGRYGGEEFIIVLPGCDRDASGQMAERLRLGFDSDPVNTPEGTFNVTMSLGVTSVQGGSDTSIKRVIRSADEALYRAKNSGRNRVELSFANVVPVLQAGTARPSHAEPVSVPSRKPLQPLAKWSRGEPMT
jgi:diguanylate cyclase (GGDEF)-like protein